MPRNVLLMLSDAQPPHPDREIRWHADHARTNGTTYVVTPRKYMTGLRPGESTVFFYGNAGMGNRYLGRASFRAFIPMESPRGRELRNQILQDPGHIYNNGRGGLSAPPGTGHILELENFALPPDQPITRIVPGHANRLTLRRDDKQREVVIAVPVGPASIQVYFDSEVSLSPEAD